MRLPVRMVIAALAGAACFLLFAAVICGFALAASADSFPPGYTTGAETYPPPSCAGLVTEGDKGCGPVVGLEIRGCDSIAFDPSYVQVTLHFFDEGASSQYAFEVHPYEDPQPHFVVVHTDNLQGHQGRVDASWNIGSGIISKSFDCLPEPTTTTTEAPTTTTTAAPPTTTAPPQISTPTSIQAPPAAPAAPITPTCPEGSQSPDCLPFTGPSSHLPQELGLGAAASAIGAALAFAFRKRLAR